MLNVWDSLWKPYSCKICEESSNPLVVGMVAKSCSFLHTWRTQKRKFRPTYNLKMFAVGTVVCGI